MCNFSVVFKACLLPILFDCKSLICNVYRLSWGVENKKYKYTNILGYFKLTKFSWNIQSLKIQTSNFECTRANKPSCLFSYLPEWSKKGRQKIHTHTHEKKTTSVKIVQQPQRFSLFNAFNNNNLKKQIWSHSQFCIELHSWIHYWFYLPNEAEARFYHHCAAATGRGGHCTNTLIFVQILCRCTTYIDLQANSDYVFDEVNSSRAK